VSFPVEVLGETEVPRALTKFPDSSHQQHHGENPHGHELVMEGQVVTHDEPTVGKDEQLFFGTVVDLDHIDAQTVTRATILPDSISL